jgi:uncharacterized membrane protein
MLKSNSELRANALKSLKGKWGSGVIISLIFAFSYCVFPFSLLITPVTVYGLAVACLKSYRGEQLTVDNLFDGFRKYVSTFGKMLLMYIYIMLWSLLFSIPGIIKSYSYAMTPYLICDHPDLGAEALICKSMKMMKGHKMKLFLLDLSFVGWWLLCILTLGIGLLWLIPYVQSARAAFYENLRTATDA